MSLDQYEILRQLAMGGMSDIYLARPKDAEGDHDLVVIKRILPRLAKDPQFLKLFEEETRISRLMNHPNVVRTLDSGEEDGHPFIVMEYIDGVDCWKLANRCSTVGKPITEEVSIFIISEVLRALAHVHLATDENGTMMRLVHGDVSPTNIYLSRKGAVKLGDFGIAWKRRREDADSKNIMQGKVDYLAPEQVHGGVVDHRADLFSTATVLTELLCEKRLFNRGTQLTTLIAIRDVQLEVLDAHKDLLPNGIESIIRRALAREPDNRFPTANTMQRSIQRFVTTPEVDLRAKIAELVKMAIQAKSTPAPKLPSQIPQPAPEVDEDGKPTAPPPPVDSVDIDDGPASSFAVDDAAPTPLPATPVATATTYVFLQPDGKELGPFGYAAAVEGIISGRFNLSYRVSVEDEPFVGIGDVVELARHAAAMTPATAQVTSVGPPDRRGLLHDEPIWKVLFDLATARETGLAIFQRGEARKEVFFVNGNPNHVSSNISTELLGKYLVKKEVISAEQLETALNALPKFTGHLGETLTGLGIIQPLTLFRHISEQVRERILDLFNWERGEYMLYRDSKPRDTTFPLDLVTLHLLLPGLREAISEAEGIAWLKEHWDWSVGRVPSSDIDITTLGLPEDITLAVSLVKEPEPVHRLVEDMAWGSNEREAALVLRLAKDIGVLELRASSG